MGGRHYEVLWPRLHQADVVVKRDKALRQFLEQAEDKLAAGGAESRLWDTMEAMADALLRDFAALQEQPISDILRAEQRPYEDLYRRAQELAGILANDVKRDEGEFREKARYYAEQLGKDWNRVSLVFQEGQPEFPEARAERAEPDGVLMTGDVPKPILTKLVKGGFGTPRLRESYAVIKAPHHGTSSHFCAILPRSRYFCISNGEGNKNYHKITEQYEHVYGCLGKKADIRCTNPRCEFLDWNGYCPYFDKEPKKDWYQITW